jgi:hypothetical protein
MGFLKRLFGSGSLEKAKPASENVSASATDADVRLALEGFDAYSQKLILGVDPSWDSKSRMNSIVYCLFQYGAALGCARGYGREDACSVTVFGPYLSQFMEWRLSIGWLLACEQVSLSPRMQRVRAAGANTVQAVWSAAVRGRSEELSAPRNMELLIQLFSELRSLMAKTVGCDSFLLDHAKQLVEIENPRRLFADVRRVMDDTPVSDEVLCAKSCQLYDSVIEA